MPQIEQVYTFPSQIFWLVVAFAVLYFLMSKVALPRLGRVIEERRRRLDEDLEKAAQMKTEAEAVIAAYERALADARAQAQATVKETNDRLAAEAAERLRVAGAAIAEKTEAAERRIAEARAAAMASVKDIAAEVALAMTERLTGTAVDPARARAAVEAAMRERA
ncbi:MAG: F0F1 ATP synthase subunit B' [Rhodospirillales bacterium]|nr:F0F1 ATP synthase subunit B' [Rhodospirillales bacterium]